MYYQLELKDSKYFEIKNLNDLNKLKVFEEVLNIKVNFSEIAKDLGVDRRTVKKYYDGYNKPNTKEKASKIDPFIPLIRELLCDSSIQKFHYKTNLYQYLVDNYGLDVASSTFRHFIKNHEEFNQYFVKSNKISSSVRCMRYETAPGEQAQVDWKEDFTFLTTDIGYVSLNIFVFILGYSRYSIYYASLDKRQSTIFSFLSNAFEKLGGVPSVIVTDNLKTVMDKARSEYYKGEINSKFYEFAKDYGFKVQPCIVKRPRTKGKVESQMKILDELDAYQGKLSYKELIDKVGKINLRKNMSIHQGTSKTPISLLEKDKGSLKALPSKEIRSRYQNHQSIVKVNESSMISYKSNQYSLPTEYIGKTVTLQVEDNYLYLYDTTQLIVKHKITNKKLNYLKEHYQEITKKTMPYKDEVDIKKFSKENLKKIGALFDN
ncbi:IS21 family transposase [Anaerococcus urinomassiliensis]|uniref:IS21 family transposase n=2 Tax=Anaerococcus urinomassiliensis TaxID=1745712 RepID=UPI00093D5889|nr:IS21 family transposase [Anaerococcus urinomassiliensis]